MSFGHSGGSDVGAPAPDRLPRHIGPWSATAILVGTVIGSGIFRSPAVVADRVPGAGAVLGVWAIGGLVVLCGALALAELAGAFPETGGIYVFIREGWGRLPAFLFGWAELLIMRASALGAIATTCAEYAIRVAGYDPRVAPYSDHVHYLAAAAITVVGIVNYVGVRRGTTLQNVLTIVKCVGLVALVLAALAVAFPSGVLHLATPLPPGTKAGAVGAALIGALWVYDGWADVSFVSGEVQSPERNLPRVIIMGTLAITVLYLLANVAYLLVLPIDVMRHSTLVAADVAQQVAGPGAAVAIGIVVMLSTFGTLNGSMLTGPRALWAMARDGMLFRRIGHVHPKFETPSNAILLATVLGVVFVMLRTFEQLADTFVTAILPFYALAIAAIFRVRKRPGYHPRFRAVGYPVTPIVFIVAAIALLGDALRDPEAQWPMAVVFAVILAGIPFYYLVIRRRGDTLDDVPPRNDLAA